uniref:F-box domain-containing protein n=1 Tax=Mycena chlorophos TaxID=658473 RepID=A0ABQ0KVY9_MYCCL|nr:predicted protein [Mycena chlorophos]
MPAQDLPADVAREIFILCLPPSLRAGSLSTSKNNSLDPRAAPMVLLHICRMWKYIALETPELWQELALQYDS